ncbi:MAG: DeoR family transcriptional regulator [Planctomycetota bacterium]
MPKHPQPSMPQRRRKRRPHRDPQLVRQWKLLERLNHAPSSVKELMAVCRVSEKTVRRDLVVLEKVGFHLKETVEKPVGRKYWQLNKPLQLPETERQQYRSVVRLLDALAEKVAHLEDKRLMADLQIIRRQLVKKCG